jgi:hypothetical protein
MPAYRLNKHDSVAARVLTLGAFDSIRRHPDGGGSLPTRDLHVARLKEEADFPHNSRDA